jgi:arylsulfatase A-like enzyme
MIDKQSCPTPSIGRYTAVGVLGGLLIGALEGGYRYKYPSPPVLLTPNVSYVILFLGPLLDALAGGLLGFVTGFVVVSRNRIWRPIALGLGIGLVTMLVLAVAIDPRNVALALVGETPRHFIRTMGVGMLLAGAVAFIAGRLLPLRTLSGLLAGVCVLLLVGVGAYALRPSMHRSEIAAKTAGPVDGPNIILITLDTVRADHLSLYGYPRRTTPSIDTWARQGVVFENAIASTSWTLPSHASIFTGLLPHQHGADWVKPLDPSWWTLAEVLASRGYETAGFSSNLGKAWRGLGMGNGFALYDDDSTTVRHNLRSLLLGSMLLQSLYKKYVHPDDLDRRNAGQINRDVLRWFHRRSPRPFFLFINYFDAHAPYLPPPKYASRFGYVSSGHEDNIESVIDRANDHADLSAEDTRFLITNYDNCLAYLDNSVGELLDSLSHLPGWDNTVVIITSDHGEGFGEHGTYSHGHDLYREVLHVPLLILGPTIPAGHRISHVVGIQELFETVLQLAGMNNPPFARASLQRFWRPGLDPGYLDESVVSELIPQLRSPAPISLTTPEWHYLNNAVGNEELYHWGSDPIEKVNLAKSPEYQKVLRDLQTRLRATIDESLRPWTGMEYLAALGESERTLASAARLSPQLGSSSPHSPGIPIGTSQTFFPHRALTLTQHPPIPEEELLRSLPYH